MISDDTVYQDINEDSCYVIIMKMQSIIKLFVVYTCIHPENFINA